MVFSHLDMEHCSPAYSITEPGYYADGRFGIRIENIVLVREVKTPNNFGEKGYLGFEHVTMVSSASISHIFSVNKECQK